MQVDDKLVDLAPGMAVTVEIKTGSRRIIIVTYYRHFLSVNRKRRANVKRAFRVN
jgi:hypothetical protein